MSLNIYEVRWINKDQAIKRTRVLTTSASDAFHFIGAHFGGRVDRVDCAFLAEYVENPRNDNIMSRAYWYGGLI